MIKKMLIAKRYVVGACVAFAAVAIALAHATTASACIYIAHQPTPPKSMQDSE